MTQARDIHGNVFTGGSVTLMARVLGNDAKPLDVSTVDKVAYSIFLLDVHDPRKQFPVRGYRRMPVDCGEILFPQMQIDARWTADSIGYNFRHTLSGDNGRVFSAMHRNHLVVYTISQHEDAAIMVRFRLWTV